MNPSLEHQNAHPADHESKEQLRIIFEQAGIGMGRVLPTGRWIQVNQKLCSLLGYTSIELLGKTMAEVLHPEELERSQQMYEKITAIDGSQETLEKRYLTSQGDVLWSITTISAVRSSSGKILYFIVTVQDITQRKQAALALENQKNDLIAVNLVLTKTMSKLEQRNQELDQFAYVTSHDLKAPLRAIVNLASWIEEDLGDALPQENKDQLELLKSRVRRMEGLINGLLEYSQVDRTHQSHEQVNTAALIQEIVESLSVPEGFSVELASNLPVIQAKKVRLYQVFLNLIQNAVVHHNRSDGHMQVTVCELESAYEFSIIDDGPGIEPAYHEKIFAIFQTLKARDEFESTGIGLSLVKKIVVAEGGSVTVESAPGKGSTFRVTWPKTPHQGIRWP